MPKKTMDFPEQINLLAMKGTQAKLRAIAYYRGYGGQYAAPAREFINRGIAEFIKGLEPKERKVFDEILSNVEVVKEYKK